MDARAVNVSIPQETVPDDALVYRRVWSEDWTSNGCKLRVFRNSEPEFGGQRVGMSVSWSRHASPEDVADHFGHPLTDLVAELSASDIREIDSLLLEHTPETEVDLDSAPEELVRRRLLRMATAHCEVFGEKDEEIRTQLRRRARIVFRDGKRVDVPLPCWRGPDPKRRIPRP